MATLTRAVPLAVVLALIAAPATTQTRADFDTCNQHAAAQVADRATRPMRGAFRDA